jgi:hypothetical protein
VVLCMPRATSGCRSARPQGHRGDRRRPAAVGGLWRRLGPWPTAGRSRPGAVGDGPEDVGVVQELASQVRTIRPAGSWSAPAGSRTAAASAARPPSRPTRRSRWSVMARSGRWRAGGQPAGAERLVRHERPGAASAAGGGWRDRHRRRGRGGRGGVAQGADRRAGQAGVRVGPGVDGAGHWGPWPGGGSAGRCGPGVELSVVGLCWSLCGCPGGRCRWAGSCPGGSS